MTRFTGFVELTRPVFELPVGYVSRVQRYAYDEGKVTLIDSQDSAGGYNAYTSGVRFIDAQEYEHKRVANVLTNAQKRMRKNILAQRRRAARASPTS